MAELSKTIDLASGGREDLEGKYLTFALADEEYGIGILKVKEIIGMMPITSVPRTSAFVKGVINLRGKIIPVIDLRIKFGMKEIEYTERTCIIVVEIEKGRTDTLMGIVVDAVSEVINIKSTDIEETPALGSSMSFQYLLGMAKTGDGVKILLDIDQVLSEQAGNETGDAKEKGVPEAPETVEGRVHQDVTVAQQG